MWSEDSFAGRASRALRNDLQKESSDMMGCWGAVAYKYKSSQHKLNAWTVNAAEELVESCV